MEVALASILKVTTPSPRCGGEGEGHPSGRGGTWTRKVTCRYFMNGFCKEGDNCQYSHGLPKNLDDMVRRNYRCVQENCGRSECNGPHKVKPAAPKLHSPASPGLPPRADPLGEVNPGTLKPPNAGFAGIGTGIDDWVYAIEFVPGKPYYGRFSHTWGAASQQGHMTAEKGTQTLEEELNNLGVGECTHNEGPMCNHEKSRDLCGQKVPNTEDATQRLIHIQPCTEAHEQDMELAFAVQRSRNLVCGICMEVIFEKASPNEVCFGILSNCNHPFCLKCIQKWRSAKQFGSKIIKACPECQVTSNLVIPSKFWVEDEEHKEKLIQQYKEAKGKELCRYFNRGRSSCPFGHSCFYKHRPVETEQEQEAQGRGAGVQGAGKPGTAATSPNDKD